MSRFREETLIAGVALASLQSGVIIVDAEHGEEFELSYEEGTGCTTVEQAVTSLVLAAFQANPRQQSMSAADILKRWNWYGVPMPPKPTLDELRAAMVVVVEGPSGVLVWANRGREFRDPKDGPTGDGEARIRPAEGYLTWTGLSR